LATSVGQIMTEKLETINASSSAQEAAKKMHKHNVSSLVVVDDNNKPVGMVTERDLVRTVCASGANSNTVTVQSIMSSPIVTIDANSPIEAAADVMVQNRVRHLVVVDRAGGPEDRTIGIITPTDFTAYLKENLDLDEVNATILKALREEGGNR
jgi:CBS domain-containing protein